MKTNILNRLWEFVLDEISITQAEAFDVMSNRKSNNLDTIMFERLQAISSTGVIHINREEAKSILKAILL